MCHLRLREYGVFFLFFSLRRSFFFAFSFPAHIEMWRWWDAHTHRLVRFTLVSGATTKYITSRLSSPFSFRRIFHPMFFFSFLTLFKSMNANANGNALPYSFCLLRPCCHCSGARSLWIGFGKEENERAHNICAPWFQLRLPLIQIIFRVSPLNCRWILSSLIASRLASWIVSVHRQRTERCRRRLMHTD